MVARGGGARRRGFALVVFTAAILAVGVSLDPLVDDAKRHYEGWAERVAAADDGELFRAREMLEHYMHARAADGRGVKIRAGAAYIEPRFLMLPCPDNLGSDRDLDGTQDPTCSLRANKPPLAPGSRFGRLPWKLGEAENLSGGRTLLQVGDGLGSDFKDAAGNRLWYAVSRNFVEVSDPHPLNLHYIANLTTGWLTVRNGRRRRSFPGELLPESNSEWESQLSMVAAVIIAPGAARDGQQRIEEDALADANLRTADRRVKADLYFEKVKMLDGMTVRNYENDGEFVAVSRAPWMRNQSNDILTFTTLDDLTNPDFPFMRGYKKQMGMSSAQNSLYENSPLDDVRKGIEAYYDFFGFYPTPAALRSDENVATRARHCAEWKIGESTAATIPAGTPLLTPDAITMTIVTDAAGVSDVKLKNNAPFLMAEELKFPLTIPPLSPSGVTLGDYSLNNFNSYAVTVTLTLARLTRITLTAGKSFSVSTPLSGMEYTVLAGMTVFPSTSALVTLPDDSPLAPDGMLFGWFPEHSRKESTVANNGTYLTVRGRVYAGFIGGNAVLTTNARDRITILSGDKLLYESGDRFQPQDNSDRTYKIPAMSLRKVNGTIEYIAESNPLREVRDKRGFAIFLTADAQRFSRIRRGGRRVTVTITVESPAVVYPWREKAGDLAITRDNLHPYPPCFDSRDVLVDSSRLFMEDQPMHYAVAADCHYGGENCGGGNGLNISVAAGVEFGLPSDYTVASDADYVMTLAIMPHISGTIGAIDRAAVTIVGGVVDGIQLTDYVSVPMITLRKSQWVLADRAGDARGKMSLDFALTVSATLTFPAGTRFRSTVGVVVDKVRALIMYSPGPLPAVQCLGEVSQKVVTVALVTVAVSGRCEVRKTLATVSSQHREKERLDLRKPCNWLDWDENADGDEYFVIPPPKRDRKPEQCGESPERDNYFIDKDLEKPDFNDYFILFGGRVSVVAS